MMRDKLMITKNHHNEGHNKLIIDKTEKDNPTL